MTAATTSRPERMPVVLYEDLDCLVTARDLDCLPAGLNEPLAEPC
jgi:hypothetical protein